MDTHYNYNVRIDTIITTTTTTRSSSSTSTRRKTTKTTISHCCCTRRRKRITTTIFSLLLFFIISSTTSTILVVLFKATKTTSSSTSTTISSSCNNNHSSSYSRLNYDPICSVKNSYYDNHSSTTTNRNNNNNNKNKNQKRIPIKIMSGIRNINNNINLQQMMIHWYNNSRCRRCRYNKSHHHEGTTTTSSFNTGVVTTTQPQQQQQQQSLLLLFSAQQQARTKIQQPTITRTITTTFIKIPYSRKRATTNIRTTTTRSVIINNNKNKRNSQQQPPHYLSLQQQQSSSSSCSLPSSSFDSQSTSAFKKDNDTIDPSTSSIIVCCPYTECWSQTSWTIMGDIVVPPPPLLLSTLSSPPQPPTTVTVLQEQQQQHQQQQYQERMDTILQTLVSPAPQSFYVLQRALQLLSSSSSRSSSSSCNSNSKDIDDDMDALRHTIEILHYLIKDDYTFVIPLKQNQQQQQQEEHGLLWRPGIDWNILPLSVVSNNHNNNKMNNSIEDNNKVHHDNNNHSCTEWVPVPRFQKIITKKKNRIYYRLSYDQDSYNQYTTLQLSKQILDIVLQMSSYSSSSSSSNKINHVLQILKQRLFITLGTDIRGRSGVDTALTLAYAGIVDDDTTTTIYDTLTKITRLELQRTGYRSSQRVKDMVHIVEKIAAAGLRLKRQPQHQQQQQHDDNSNDDNNNDEVKKLYMVASQCVQHHMIQRELKQQQQQQQTDDDDDDNDLIASGQTTDTTETPLRTTTIPITTLQQLEKEQLISNNFHLLHSRPLLWLWRFASDLDKISEETGVGTTTSTIPLPLSSSQSPPNSQFINWNESYHDPTRPLIIDIGCGFGVSLLGLASLSSVADNNDHQSEHVSFNENSSRTTTPTISSSEEHEQQSTQKDIQKHFIYNENWNHHNHRDPTNWLQDCNFIGCDWQDVTVRYGNAMSQRWKVSDKLQYYRQPAEQFLDTIITSYPAVNRIKCIMIQFPTPYQLVTSSSSSFDDMKKGSGGGGGGNTQLPMDSETGFMVSSRLMEQIVTILQLSQYDDAIFLFQSNCEDVAVHVRNLAKQYDLECIPAPSLSASSHFTDTQHEMNDHGNNNNNQNEVVDENGSMTQRTARYVAMGGERAIGSDWWPSSSSSTTFLPNYCATETEAACHFHQTPIHRFAMRKKEKKLKQ